MNFVLICFLLWRWHNGHNIMYYKIFPVFCLFFVFTDWCCMGQYCFFCLCQVIELAYIFGKRAPFTAIMDAISLWFSAMDNALLRASRNFPADEIEEWITFALSHACLYLAESYDEQEDKSAAANTFDISCGGGGYSSLLSYITVSVLAYFQCSLLLNIHVILVSTKWSTIQWLYGGLIQWFNVGNRIWRYKYLLRFIRVTQPVIMLK